MLFKDMTPKERLNCFTELLSCGENGCLWEYDKNGSLLSSSGTDMALHKIFLACGLMDYLLDYIKESDDLIVISIPQGLIWSASFLTDAAGSVEKIYLYGPVTMQELSTEALTSMMNNSMVSTKWVPKFRRIIDRIPIIMSTVFFDQAVMLNYCVTGRKISVSDIVFYNSSNNADILPEKQKRNRIKTYMAEKELLRMVKEGNLNYQKALNKAVTISSGVRSGEKDVLRSTRISQIVFISLCTRAAIEGGLSPETAYSKGDKYISDVMNCRSVSDAVHIGHTMYDDFIRTVHDSLSKPGYSPHVQSCVDYIEAHLEEPIELQYLAARIGYSEYYLSRKFKKETGKSVNEYIRDARINQAKILLETTQMSIQDISERLCFGTRSFFAGTFRKIAGMPPAEYRRKYQKL